MHVINRTTCGAATLSQRGHVESTLRDIPPFLSRQLATASDRHVAAAAVGDISMCDGARFRRAGVRRFCGHVSVVSQSAISLQMVSGGSSGEVVAAVPWFGEWASVLLHFGKTELRGQTRGCARRQSKRPLRCCPSMSTGSIGLSSSRESPIWAARYWVPPIQFGSRLTSTWWARTPLSSTV
jgi:hypothetical protein